MRISFLPCLLFISLSANALADTPEPATPVPSVNDWAAYQERSLFGVATLGLAFGGDKIETARYDGKTEHVYAGDMIHLGFGMEWHQKHWPISLRATINLESSNISDFLLNSDQQVDSKTDNISLSRFPLELTGYLHLSDHIVFGAGWRLVTNIHYQYEVDNDAKNGWTKFDQTQGRFLEVGYKFNPASQLCVRHTRESYITQGSKAVKPRTYDARHTGLFFTSLF